MRTAVGELKVHTVCQMILAAVAVGAALFWLRSVLLPFILALFLVTGLSPVLHAIERKLRAPRMIAVGIAFLLGIVLFMCLWLLVWLSVASLLRNADTYRERIVRLVTVAERWVPGAAERPGQPAAEEGDSRGEGATEERASGAAVGPRPGAAEPVGTNGGVAERYDFSAFLTRHVGEIMARLSSGLMELLSSALMVLIFMFFLLLGDSTTAVRRQGVWNEIESGIRNYIVTKTVISLVTGLVFGLVLWFFGVPLALVFGLLAFLLNFIPNIGPVIASLLPLPLILLDPHLSLFSMLAVILLSSTVQFVSGNVVEPKIMGDSFRLHPVAILLTLMLWGMLWGIVGMFLATPITAAIKVLLEQLEHTRPIARWLEGHFDLGTPGAAGQAANGSPPAVSDAP